MPRFSIGKSSAAAFQSNVVQDVAPGRAGNSPGMERHGGLRQGFDFTAKLFGIFTAIRHALLLSFFQRGTLFFQPRINHRASCSFGVFVRSGNCFLYRQSIPSRINSHAPVLSRDPYPEYVANASVFHHMILDQNWRFICDDDHAGPGQYIAWRWGRTVKPLVRHQRLYLELHNVPITNGTIATLRAEFPAHIFVPWKREWSRGRFRRTSRGEADYVLPSSALDFAQHVVINSSFRTHIGVFDREVFDRELKDRLSWMSSAELAAATVSSLSASARASSLVITIALWKS
jgi:hypothetical protein